MQNRMEVSDQTLCGHQPNFLILDEPTNHLDVQTIEALGNAILKYKVSGNWIGMESELFLTSKPLGLLDLAPQVLKYCNMFSVVFICVLGP